MAAPIGPDNDRAAQITALAARIAAVAPSGAADSARGAAAASTRSRWQSAPAIGTDTERSVPPSGGHPEDSPGDPAAVAKAICLRMLTAAPRTRATLADALRRKDIPADVADAVLDRLTEVGLIDDATYAEAFVLNKHRDRGLGRNALRAELRRKGVAEDVVAGAVTAIDSDAERDRARALISHRVDSAMAAGPAAARRRLVALLARRGYGPSVAIPVVDEALSDYGVDPTELSGDSD